MLRCSRTNQMPSLNQTTFPLSIVYRPGMGKIGYNFLES